MPLKSIHNPYEANPPGAFALLGAVYVAEGSQAEATLARGVHVTVHGDRRHAGRHLERLAHLVAMRRINGVEFTW